MICEEVGKNTPFPKMPLANKGILVKHHTAALTSISSTWVFALLFFFFR